MKKMICSSKTNRTKNNIFQILNNSFAFRYKSILKNNSFESSIYTNRISNCFQSLNSGNFIHSKVESKFTFNKCLTKPFTSLELNTADYNKQNLDFQREMIMNYFNDIGKSGSSTSKDDLKRMFESYISFYDEINNVLDKKRQERLLTEFTNIINKTKLNENENVTEKINSLFEEVRNNYTEDTSANKNKGNKKVYKSVYFDLNTPNQFKGKSLKSTYKKVDTMMYYRKCLYIMKINLFAFFESRARPITKRKYVIRGKRMKKLKYLLILVLLFMAYRVYKKTDRKIKLDFNGDINGKKFSGSVNLDSENLGEETSNIVKNLGQNSSLPNAFENFPQLFNKKDTFTPVLQTKIKTSLSEVKGIDEVKDEIEQLIRIIKNPEKYKNAGAKLPKGILLVGKPGTGKTLLAKAIAGDSKVNFISTSGSDFEEMYVGVGSTRIKKLFTFAKENSPCIIFIDEIDALLTNSKRSDKEHSSSRSTINTFLTEMDGFNKIDGVFVIGATNHEKDLDSAAVRPGRFDKRIHVNLPSINGREEIADFYLNKIMVPKTNDITKKIIGQMTTGFTGAEIENLINISGIMAINNNKGVLDLKTLTDARDRILMGISGKYTQDTSKRRYMTAVHEMGHTLTCYKNKDCREALLKVTIVPSGPALGVTQRVEVEDTLYNKDYYLYNIDMALGGHIAEKIIFGEDNVTAGCSSDLSKATQMARKMVNEGYYAKDIGYVYVEQQQSVKEEKLGDKYKEIVNKKIDEVLSLSHDRVLRLLETNSDELIKLSRALFKYNTLDVNEITLILENRDNEITRPVIRQDFEEKNSDEYS